MEFEFRHGRSDCFEDHTQHFRLVSFRFFFLTSSWCQSFLHEIASNHDRQSAIVNSNISPEARSTCTRLLTEPKRIHLFRKIWAKNNSATTASRVPWERYNSACIVSLRMLSEFRKDLRLWLELELGFGVSFSRKEIIATLDDVPVNKRDERRRSFGPGQRWR